MKKLLFLFLLLPALFSFSQSETHDFVTYDTLINGPAAQGLSGITWRLRISRPAGMFGNGPDSQSRPLIMFSPGVGQMGTDYSTLQFAGPHYWLNNGWDGGIALPDGRHYPILITAISSNTWFNGKEYAELLNIILSIYHIKRNSVNVGGLSMGGMASSASIYYERVPGDEFGMKQVTSLLCLEGIDEWPNGYPSTANKYVGPAWTQWASKYNGKFFGLEGTNDARQIRLVADQVNAGKSGNGYLGYETIGGGGHCCWNDMMNPSATSWRSVAPYGANMTSGEAATSMGTYQDGDYLMKWMFSQGDISMVGAAAALSANAGTDVSITLPVSTVNLAGNGTPASGTTITGYSWTRVSGPSTPTESAPNAANNTLSGLVAGTYVYRLTVTTNMATTATDDISIVVNSAANAVPVVNAGPTQAITLPASSVTMAGSASDPDGTIGSAVWSRVSGPNTPTITTPSNYTTTITGLIAGIYSFRLSATDNNGATSTSDVTITVNAAANIVPVVSAGSIQVINLPASSVTISGSASDADGTITSATWSRVSGPNTPTIATPSSYTTTITGLIAGTYVFRLSATDNSGATSTADVTIIVNNIIVSPIVSAGSRIVWNASTDDIVIDNIVFGKKLKAGDTIIIPARPGGYASQSYQGVNSGAAGEYVVVQFEPGAYLSPLAVDNIKSYLDSCSGLKIVGMKMYQRGAVPFRLGNSPYGPDRGIPRGYSSYIWIDGAQLIGSSTFENDYSGTFPDFAGDTTKMFHHWKWTNCLIDSSANKGVVTAQVAISLGKITTDGYWRDVEISNCVFDHFYSVSSPSVYINCTNSYNVSIHNNTFRNLGMTDYPVGHAASIDYNSSRVDIFNNVFGPDNFGNDVRGSNSDLLIPGYMGRNRIYNNVTFDKRKFPFCDAYDISPANLSTLAPYVRRRTSPEIYNITAYNMALGIGHIPYIAVILDCYVTDTATVKNCVFTQIRDAPWATSQPRVISQTNGFVAALDTSNNRYAEFFANSGLADSVTFTPQLGGALVDRGAAVPSYNTKDLWGNNRTAGAATDIGAVEYRFGGNQPPIAAAGADQIIIAPASQVTLNGNGSSDVDGSIVSYAWTKFSGGAANITTANAANTTITGLTPGTYVFQLTVTDNAGSTGTDFVTVTVNASVPNSAPIANAGPNQTITLPTNSVSLTGSGTDSDGSVTGYTWTKLSGPAATITSAGTASTTVTGLVAGVYQFQLTVTDNIGATTTASVTITVNGATNQAPVATAGSSLNITLPTNTVTLNGSGSDADGTITGYNWIKISGPAATITSPGSASTTITGLVAGIYQFQITVTDNSGATATDIVTVTVNAAANQAPIAVAGASQVITLPINTVTLSGSGTDADGTITGYAWTKLSGPAATITSAGSASTTITGLVAGTYQFQLTVTDNAGATSTDVVNITVNTASNQAPIAVAGANQVITLPVNSVTLSGSGTDADGTITGYSWAKLSGPAATITSAGSASTTITGLVAGTYQFQLTVTDNSGATGTNIVTVTVNSAANQAPIAVAGSNLNITLPTNTVTLNGSGTDADGTITGYSWTKLSGPAATITSAGSASTTITGLVAGTYQFQLTVTDNSGATGTDIVTVTVNSATNQAPIAVAGASQVITLPINSVTLSGSGTDADGTITGYSWAKLSGPAATITSAGSASTTITGLVAGTYQFQLTVTDNSGATGTDIVTVTVNSAANQAPIAVAGSNLNITLPTNSVNLNGSGTDADGTITGYSWTKLSGPAATITSAGSASTTITGLVAGTYQFQLTVTDNAGATGTDVINVTVNAATNQAPIAVAGSNLNITLPTNTVTLNGSGTDADGTITGYSWTKLTGPAATISSAGSASTTITGLVAGTYQFQLTVTDNAGATGTDVVNVTVNSATNQAPIAVAGANQVITLPVNSVTLSGSGTDADGTITAYSWTKISGPSATITSSSSASTNVTGLVAGVYQFQLTVTDNNGATGTGLVTVTVNNAANQAPIADAGSNINISLPTNSVTLSGSGVDLDGTITGYAWSKLSGPAATITSAGSASTTITGLVAGTYQFLLTVTDNAGATGTDVVNVTVNSATNQAPIAVAGSNLNITLPTNTVTLNGSGTDADGTITGYSWTKLSGPAATITSAGSASTTITGLVAGTYQFQLTVTDNAGATGTDVVNVTVNSATNQAPIAVAGSNLNITLPTNTVTLNGSGTDADGTITGYSWTKLSGPAATITSAGSASTTITGLVAGTYQFQLTVTDNAGATGTDVVNVTVNSATNQAPIALAGSNLNITLPTNTVTLNGSGTDADGTITGYSWTKLSGPAATITSAGSASTTITGLVAGVYQFQLEVTDNSGGTATDVITVTVNPAHVNSLPIANAGADRAIFLPASDVVLDGTGSFDPDGTILSYSWVKISGPNPATVINATTNRATLTTVFEGIYEFELTVVDNSGGIAKDRVIITVRTAGVLGNYKPIANAGTDATISAPANNSVLLDGSRSTDPDGTIVGYAWKLIASPAGANATIVTPGGITTAVNGLTVEGDYLFELTVTDNSGESSKDTVKIGSINTLRVTYSMQLFPNPASDFTKLRIISEKTGKIRMKIVDELGRFVEASDLEKNTTLYEKTINVSHLTPGSYFIMLEFSDGEHITKKFLKL